MEQYAASMPTFYYRLQPGDATLYRFSISDLDRASGYNLTKRDLELANIRDVISDGSNDHILITIYGNTIVSFVIHKEVLRNLERSVATSIQYRFPEANLYTIMAVLLAASRLMDNQVDVQSACREMLKAGRTLYVES